MKALVIPYLALIQTVLKQSGVGLSYIFKLLVDPKDPLVVWNIRDVYKKVLSIKLDLNTAGRILNVWFKDHTFDPDIVPRLGAREVVLEPLFDDIRLRLISRIVKLTNKIGSGYSSSDYKSSVSTFDVMSPWTKDQLKAFKDALSGVSYFKDQFPRLSLLIEY